MRFLRQGLLVLALAVFHLAPPVAGAGVLQDAIFTAKTQHKPLLIEFFAEWCGPCRVFDQERTTKADLVSALHAVHLVRIDVESEEGAALARPNRFGVLSMPTFVVVDPEQERIVFRWNGYDRFGFLEWLARALQERNKVDPIGSSALKASALSHFSKQEYADALRGYRALSATFARENRGSLYTPYDLQIFLSLVRGRMRMLDAITPDPLGIFSLEAVLAAAKQVTGNQDPRGLVLSAEVVNELATLDAEEAVPGLSEILSWAWNRADAIRLTDPRIFARLRANYLAVVTVRKKEALATMKESAYELLPFSAWCRRHKINLKEAALLIEKRLEMEPDKIVKGDLLYSLARLRWTEGRADEALDALDGVLDLEMRYSPRHLFLEGVKKEWSTSP